MSANAIDLTTIAEARGYMGLVGQQAGGPVVQTSIALAITAGVQIVTPETMANISVNMALLIDSGTAAEYVLVTAISGTTFTASFALNHAAGAQVSDQTDAVLQTMITSASEMFLDRTGFASMNSVGTFDEFYDGNGNATLMLRQNPIVAVTGVFIGTVSVQQSTSALLPGWVIDPSLKAIRLRNGGGGVYGVPFTFAQYAAYQSGWTTYGFPRGILNVEVQYTAGYSAVPFDVNDKVTQLVAVNYKRRSWIDQMTQALQGAGTTTFHKWIWPPEVEDCIRRYQRRSQS